MTSLLQLATSRNFTLFFCVTAASNIGSWMQRVVLSVLVWKITGSAFWLGVFVSVEVATAVLLGPLGGVWADRHDARKLVGWCCSAAATASFALAALASLGQVSIPVLLVYALVSGLVQVVAGPATQAMISSLFAQDNLPSIVAINSVTFNVARFVGPVLALIAISYGSYGLVFLLNGLSFVPQVIALRYYRPAGAPAKTGQHRSLATDLRAGFAYVRGTPAIFCLLATMAATSLLARPFMDLLPSIADRQFGRAEDGTALLTSACGVGALLGGLALAALGRRRQLAEVPLAMAFLLGVCLLVLSATADFHVGLAVAGVFGLAAIANAVSTISLLQISASPEQRGRVMSYYFMVFRGFMSLGALVEGVLQDAVGTQVTLLVAGAATLLSTALAYRKWRSVVSRLVAA